MKPNTLTFVFSFLWLFACNLQANDDLILELPITLLSGETITLSQYKNDKPIYLKFWATWCQPCMAEMPHLQQSYEQFGDKIQFIAINLDVNDDAEAVETVKQTFGLTMPIAVDASGALSQAVDLVGTPFHVLIDRDGDIVHTGHEASGELDKKLTLLSAAAPADLPNITLSSESSNPITLIGDSKETTALLFVATWCDDYFETSRPAMSQNCIQAQQTVNMLSQRFSDINWIGIISRLWTGDAEMAAYQEKYNVPYPLQIDSTNDAFFGYGIKDFPTLLLIKEGKEVLRVDNFENAAALSTKLQSYIE